MKRLLLVAMFCLAGCLEVSTGNRAGQVTKFSKKGLVCKTWEGELQVGGQANVVGVGQVFAFTVEDEALVPKLDSALASGVRTKLSYRQEFAHGPCRSDTAYFITAVN